MKRLLGIAAIAGLLTAAPAFAGVDVFVQFGTPVYTTPAPVYVAPATYYGHGPRWYHRHDRFDRHFHRGHVHQRLITTVVGIGVRGRH